MALVRTNLLSEVSGAAVGTGSFTTSGTGTTRTGEWIIVCVGSNSGGSINASNLTIADSQSNSYTSLMTFDATPSSDMALRAWGSVCASGAAGVTWTCDAGADSTDTYSIVVFSYAGADTSGLGATGTANFGLNPTSGSITLSGAPALASEVVGFVLGDYATSTTTSVLQGSTFTEQYDFGLTGHSQAEAETRTNSTSTTVDWQDFDVTPGTNIDGAAAIAFEIKAAATTATVSSPPFPLFAVGPQYWLLPHPVDPPVTVTISPFIPFNQGETRRVAYLRRGARRVQPVPPQQNPPLTPFNQGEFRRLPAVRRSSRALPVPDQAQPYPRLVQRRRYLPMLRRGDQVAPVPPQFNPPYPLRADTQRRVWPSLLRRGSHRWPTPSQAPAPNPPITFNPTQHRVWPSLVRRGRAVSPVPPQFNPPYPLKTNRQVRALRGWPLQRGHQVTPTPVQQAAPQNPALTFNPGQHRVWASLIRRGRAVKPVPPQLNPPYPMRSNVQHRIWPTLIRRGRAVTPVRAQQNPPIVFPPVRARRALLIWRRAGRRIWQFFTPPTFVADATPDLIFGREPLIAPVSETMLVGDELGPIGGAESMIYGKEPK